MKQVDKIRKSVQDPEKTANNIIEKLSKIDDKITNKINTFRNI